MVRTKLRRAATGLHAVVLAIALSFASVACDTSGSDASGDNAEVFASVVPCETTLHVDSIANPICLDEVGGHTSIVVMPEVGLTTEVVFVDGAGPVLGVAEMTDLLVGVVAEFDASATGIAFVALVPAEVSVPVTCDLSSPGLADCDLSKIAALHFEGYRDSLIEVRAWFPNSNAFHVLGASFAAARWEYLVVGSNPQSIDLAVFMSPLAAGMSAEELSEGVATQAQVVFRQLASGCHSPDCFVNIDYSACLATPCAAEVPLAELTGMARGEVLVGMIGLLPALSINGRLVSEAITEGEGDLLRRYLEHGMAVIRGVDSFGNYSADHVHFLAAVCSSFSNNGGAERSLFPECEGVQTLPVFEAALNDLRNEDVGTKFCFYSPQPDPVMGLSSTLGHRFGNSMFSATEMSTEFAHGDLGLGARRLLSLMQDGSCPIPRQE